MAVKKLIDFQFLSKHAKSLFPWLQHIAPSPYGGLSNTILKIFFLEN